MCPSLHCHGQCQEINIKGKNNDRPPKVPTQWHTLLRIKLIKFFLSFSLPKSWKAELFEEFNKGMWLLQDTALICPSPAKARGFPNSSVGQEHACNAADPDWFRGGEDPPSPAQDQGLCLRARACGPPLCFILCVLPFPYLSLECSLHFLPQILRSTQATTIYSQSPLRKLSV